MVSYMQQRLSCLFNSLVDGRDRGFDVKSYGTGSCVKIPGPSIDRPNMYEFDSVTYEEMYQDLLKKNKLL